MKIPRIPNEDTLEAMSESEKILKSGKSRFKNADEMFEDFWDLRVLKPEYTR